jgi:hypothetical protein
MAKHTPGPWRHYHGKLRPQFPNLIHEIQDGNGNAIVQWTGFDGLDLPKKQVAANAHLIAAAPSMLALLEKALPIISQEAERREDWGERHNAELHQYATEMSDLRDAIIAEIDKAHGKEVKHG